jgi:ribosomal protein S20
LAKTPRKWTGARSPSGLKRVRSSARRHVILEPRRSSAKTLVKAALAAVASPTGGDADEALKKAMSALDRAAKVGAIHRNQAARRKSRLAIKVYDAVSGAAGATGAAAKTVSRAQAQKAAKARIAAGKADKAKGAQTAAGKARAALHKSTRGEAAEAAPKAAAKPAAKGAQAKAAPAKAAASRAVAKPAAKASAAKATAKPATKAAAKAPAKKAAKS